MSKEAQGEPPKLKMVVDCQTCDEGCCARFTISRDDKKHITAGDVIVCLEESAERLLELYSPDTELFGVMQEMDTRRKREPSTTTH